MRAAASDTEAALGLLFLHLDAVRVDVPLLQPAEPFLDAAGEALRRRMFLTRGEAGETLCLRPEFTIPVCLEHLRAPEPLPRRYSYLGPVFRQAGAGAQGESRQAGLEDLGDADRAGADARALADALLALDVCGVTRDMVDVVLGDQGLFEAFLAGLGLPESWQRRLIHTFGDDRALAGALGALSDPNGDALDRLDPVLRRLAAARDHAALTDAVEARKAAAGLPPHSGRTAAEIAARLIEKVRFAETRLDAAALGRLGAFLAVDCPLSEAASRLAAVCGADIDLGPALAGFEARAVALEAAGIDTATVRFRAAFGRPLDYYTGLVFEVRAPAGSGEAVAGGGRYDRLLAYLGARGQVPAVGFSFYLDRIEAVRR